MFVYDFAQDLGQHVRILHRQAASLAHHGHAGVRGVTNEDHATALPLIQLHPLDGRAVDLLVAREKGQVFRDRPSECRKALAQAFKPTDLPFP